MNKNVFSAACACLLALAVALAGCSRPGHTASRTAAAKAPPDTSGGVLVRAGAFERIYDPSVGEEEAWYIDDHCFVRGSDGTWHLFGITHAEPAAPLDEDHFAHATAQTLTQTPWDKQSYAMSARPGQGEEHLWAPHVIEHEGTYYMFYTAGAKDHTQYKIHLATSSNLEDWTRHPDNPMVVDGFDARDPYVLQQGDTWVMYYTATSEPGGGNHIVAYRTSDNLVDWSERQVAYTDSTTGTSGGPTESPTVVQRGPAYYLFIGPTGGYRGENGYVGTAVYRSADPFYWDRDAQVGHLESHAAEVVRDAEGRWYVSHAGWGQGGVYLPPCTGATAWRRRPPRFRCQLLQARRADLESLAAAAG